jgi:Porin subfamily
MKMVKSLLLGSAAGLVAVSGTQAADLPVKAKPVEYVKICSLYGAGFYYIPGTDICLKIGGYIRADYGYNVLGARTVHYTGAGGAQDRTVNSYSTRHRAHFNFDSRSQTPYGTLRTYAAIHVDNENLGTVTVNPTRAFIQWAGFTFGHTKSFSDIPGTPGDDTFKSLFQTQNQSDTGANGTNQIAYTWELGNGMTLNIGADERRQRAIANLSTNAWTTVGTDPASSTHGMQFPTPFVNFSVNQAWGRFGVSAVFNPIKASYYNDNGACQPNSDQCGNPDDKWGFAVFSGIDIKAPWLGPGDHFGGYVMYGQGATRYAGGSNLASPGLYGSGQQIALGVVTDATYINGSDLELTTAWTAGVGYEHFWLPNFSTTWYGTYTKISYNDTVVNGDWFCGGGGASQGALLLVSAGPCDPGFRYWTVGSHTDWYPVPGFRLAVDVQYTRIESELDGATINLTSKQGNRFTGLYTVRDQGIWAAVFRAQRSFASGD